MTLIIGFGHKARQGKDEAATAIINARGQMYDVRKYSFGQELKREVDEAAEAEAAANGTDVQTALRTFCAKLAGVPYVENPPADPDCKYGKQRHLLQWWGAEFRRAMDPDYWVKKLDARLMADQPAVALITDVRFPNELDYIHAHNGVAIRVERVGFKDPDINPNHISETALDGYRFDADIISPDGTVDQLRRAACLVFDHYALTHGGVRKSVLEGEDHGDISNHEEKEK